MLKKYFNENSILKITLKGDIPEEKTESFLPFLNDETITVLDCYKLSRYISGSNINGLFLIIKKLNIGYSRAFEIRSYISEFTKSGKKVFVYLEDPGNTEYFIASSATRIFVPPWSTLNFIGLSIENYFIKQLLNKLKIEPEIEGFGEYKSAAEMFNRTSMSEPNKKMLEAILDWQFNNIIKLISSTRNISVTNLKKYIDTAPLNPLSAKKYNLIDDVCYENNVLDMINEEYGKDLNILKYKDYKKITRLKETLTKLKLWVTGRRQFVGLLNINGLITQGSSRSGNDYLKTCGSETVINLIKKLTEDKTVKSVVVRVLSPGGSALASDLIRNQLEELSKRKPVYISMSDVAASGGYMVSLSSNGIIANPFTLTGSIGIVAGKFNLSGLLKSAGISNESLKRGKMASIYSTNKKFTTEEKEKFIQLIGNMYIDFVSMVSSLRKLDPKDAEKAAKGRVWNSNDAKKLGLIDQIGTFKDCIDKAYESLELDSDKDKMIKVFKSQGKLSLSSFNKLSFFDPDIKLANVLNLLNRERFFALMTDIYKIK
ncbi:MAG: signal peptide peptidase SppA [Thermodesulfobacteriota bacterium]